MSTLTRNPRRLFSVHLGMSAAAGTRFRCPCCGHKTLDAPASMVLCPVCWWEDDGQEDRDAQDVRLTVNGQLSLVEARENYLRIGAAHPRFLSHVRKPQPAEM